jgi:hypothetical protein
MICPHCHKQIDESARMAELGRKKKTMTPAALEQRRAIARKGVDARKAKRLAAGEQS